MLEYCVTGSASWTKSGGRQGEIRRGYQALLILIFLILVVGFGFSMYGFYIGWMNGSLCSNQTSLPLSIIGLWIYISVIIWFMQFPFRDIKSIQKLYL